MPKKSTGKSENSATSTSKVTSENFTADTATTSTTSTTKALLQNLPKPLLAFFVILSLASSLVFTGLDQNLIKEMGLVEILEVFQKNNTGKLDRIETAKVQRVVDGDTLILDNGKTVRLLNIDTPETVKPNTPVMCYGPEASAFTKKLLTGKQVWLKIDKEATDRYGRDLRLVFLSREEMENVENSVNALLVKSGLAREKSYKPNNTYQEVFQKLQYEAQQKKVGAWGACPKPFEE